MRLLFLIVLLVTLAHAACCAPVDFKLGPQGDIYSWLTLGALPNPGKPHESCKGFAADYLAGEADSLPVENATVQADGKDYKWRLSLETNLNGLDFIRAFRTNDPAVAYAYAGIVSKTTREVKILLGSDDGVKLWVNGKLCHTSHVARYLHRDDDSVSVQLQPGLNRLLFKVDQGDGGWGLVARLVNPDGSPAADLAAQLDLSTTPDSRHPVRTSIIRSLQGKPGSLDVTALLEYESCRTRARQWLDRFKAQADSPEKLAKTLDEASNSIVKAAKASGDATSKALASSKKSIDAEFTRTRAGFVRDFQDPPPLFATNVQKEDYVRIAPQGKYFVHANGSPYIIIGYNHNPDWVPFTNANPVAREYDMKAAEAFFKHLHESGVNLVRLMLETPSSGLFENPLGTFMPEYVVWIDNLVTLARRYDIKLMMTPWDTFWMVRQWDICPYNPARGGQVAQMIDFITKPEVLEAQKRRFKYMIDRWGNSGTIFAWELLNEADQYWGASPGQLSAWTKEMSDYVRTYEKKKWGRNHLVTLSTASSMPSGGLGDLAYQDPNLDFASTHLYIGASIAPGEPIEPAVNIHDGVVFCLDAIKDNRPYIDGEDGPIARWIADAKLDDAVFHNMSWAHLASGGAGSSLRWPYRNPHHLTEGMYKSLSLMAKFTREVPWLKMCARPKTAPAVKAPAGRIAFCTGNSSAVIVWTAARDDKPSDTKLELNWPDGPSRVSYRAYDTKTGNWFASGTIEPTQQKAVIELRDAPASIALVLEAGS